MKHIDLTGKKFGKLTVIKEIYKSKVKYCLCECDCGNQKIFNSNSLVTGNTISCGCAHVQKYQDLTNQKFGRLTAVKLSEIKRRKSAGGFYVANAYWLCKCDCGSETIVSATKLLHKKVISCGCYSRECSSKKLKKVVNKSPMSFTRIDNTILMLLLLSLGYRENGRKIGVCYKKHRNNYNWAATFEINGKKISKIFDNYNDALTERLKLEKQYSIPFILENKALLKDIDINKYLNAEPLIEFDYKKHEEKRKHSVGVKGGVKL